MKKTTLFIIAALLVSALLFSSCSIVIPSPQPSESSSSSSSDSSSSSKGYSSSDIDYPSYSSDRSSSESYRSKATVKYGYTEYTCDKLSLSVPDDYREKRSSPNYYYYNDDNDFVYVHIDEMKGATLNSTFLNSYVSGLKSKSSNFSLITKESTYFAGEFGHHLVYTCNIANTDCYLNSYLAQHGDQMYTVTFTTRGFSQSSEFDKIEDDVIDSVYFN